MKNKRTQRVKRTEKPKAKELQKVAFEMSSDANIQHLGFQTMTLNTLYVNNVVFIKDFNETRDEKYIKIFMNEREELKNPKYREELFSFLTYYDLNTNESNIVLSHFVIVALYSYYERTLKNILLKTGICSKDEHRKFYRYDYLKEFFSKKLGFEYEDLGNKDFRLLEEIRCISNCIKHSGMVSDELNSINSKWIIGDEIKEKPQEDISRFIDIPHLYMKTIVDKIKKFNFKEQN